jgi:starch phosphorylase
MSLNKAEIAYFSMEIELEPDIPTYNGGLGVLAGDMLRSAADNGVPMLGVSLVHSKATYSRRWMRLDSSPRRTRNGRPKRGWSC